MNSKMIKCNVCGADIAKNANKCPNCGANLVFRKPGVWIGLILWCVALFFMVKACGALGSPSNSTPSTNSPSQDPIVVSAMSLWQAYSDNKVNADELYKDKLLAVTGTITDIGQDLVTKAPCISIDTGDSIGLYSIQCFFPKDGAQGDKLAKLSDGDIVTIFGTCNGTPVMQVQLSNCYL